MVVVAVIQVEYVKGFNMSSCRVSRPDNRYCHCRRVWWLFAVHGWRLWTTCSVGVSRSVRVRTSGGKHDGTGPKMRPGS